MHKPIRRTKSDDAPPINQVQARNWLAFGITGISILGVVILGATIIIVNDDNVTQRAQTVLNAVLPLLGTWVGTVLAYFFSRENFESASRSVERLTQQLSLQEQFQSMPVTAAMTPRNKLLIVNDPGSANLLDILAQLENRGSAKRLPIFDNNDHPKALLFRESMIDYLYRFKTRTDEERKELTIKSMLDERPDLNKPYAIVGESDTLATAQEAMLRLPECRVVFVTRSGHKDDAVLGMLTNSDFAAKVQA